MPSSCIVVQLFEPTDPKFQVEREAGMAEIDSYHKNDNTQERNREIEPSLAGRCVMEGV